MGTRSIIALAAPMPDEKATAVPCSSAPRADSRASVVGALSRAYSMEPPAWKADAGTMGVFSGRSGPGSGRPALTTTVSMCRGRRSDGSRAAVDTG
jgi:hypothetical protein